MNKQDSEKSFLGADAAGNLGPVFFRGLLLPPHDDDHDADERKHACYESNGRCIVARFRRGFLKQPKCKCHEQVSRMRSAAVIRRPLLATTAEHSQVAQDGDYTRRENDHKKGGQNE